MRLPSQQRRATILVVDDTPENLDVARHILSERYQLQVAPTGQLAIEIARRHQPDLILLDVAMPQMDGHETCQALKADPATADIPVIFVTARTDAADESHGLSLGAVDYIRKPLNPAIVHARVGNQLAIKQARDSLLRQNAELAAVNRLAERVSASLDPKAIAEIACRELVTIFDVEHASWWTLDADRREFHSIASYSAAPRATKVKGLSIRETAPTVVDFLADRRAPYVMHQSENAYATLHLNGLLNLSPTQESLVIPITRADDVIAFILLPGRREASSFRQRDIVLGRTIALHIAGAIDNASLYATSEQRLGEVRRDLDIGREIQSSFFPSRLPQPRGWELSAYFAPARQVAGDFYDAFSLGGSGRIAIVVADVCDKGVGAALYMVMLRSLIRSLAERIDDGDSRHDVQRLATSVNNYLVNTHANTDMFATLFLAILAPDSDSLAFVNSGHQPAMLIDAKGQRTATLGVTGPAIGLMEHAALESEEVRFRPGDTLVAYTDGVTDARNAAGEPFGTTTLEALLGTPAASALSLVNTVLTTLGEHTRGVEQYDDVTLLAVRRCDRDDLPHHHMQGRAATDALPSIKGFIERAGEQLDVGVDAAFSLKLAAEEAVINIIEHGDGDGGPVEIGIRRDDDRAVLTLRDKGTPFDFTTVEKPDLDGDWTDRPVGQLGLHLIKQMVDDVAYETTPDGENRLTLTMNLSTALD